MSEEVKAPWTEDQVDTLNRYQHNGYMHPFTCVNRNDGKHKWTSDLGVLTATPNGWTCESCDYTQDWAWDFMADPKSADAFGAIEFFMKDR